MAQRRFQMCLALVLMTMTWAQTWAQPNCTPVIASLSPCLGFITGNSSIPSSTCCSQLASVVQTQSQCLCTVLNGMPPLPLPFVVNQTQALTLPGACNIQTPPVSQCNAASGAAPAPAPAPAPVSPQTPTVPTAPSTSTPSVPSGTPPKTPVTPSTPSVPSAKAGSKTGPTTGASSSASSSEFAPLLVFFLAMASVLSGF